MSVLGVATPQSAVSPPRNGGSARTRRTLRQRASMALALTRPYPASTPDSEAWNRSLLARAIESKNIYTGQLFSVTSLSLSPLLYHYIYKVISLTSWPVRPPDDKSIVMVHLPARSSSFFSIWSMLISKPTQVEVEAELEIILSVSL